MRARLGVAALVAVALLGLASATASASPQAGLIQARSELGSLAATAPSTAARNLLSAAESELASATVASLWIDSSHPVAPPYGSSVFAHSRTALVRLERVAPAGAVAGVQHSVLVADRLLALAAIRQAIGGAGGGLLARASGLILSGDRWAETSRVDLGAVQYGAAWSWAFEALRETVELRAALVSPRSVATAAENALRGRRSVTPAGVRAVSGHSPLSGSGKPEVLFVGLASCRFCALQRWGLVAALSQFGSFENLHLSQSTTTEPPVVRSFTLHGSTYDSFWVSFDAVELTSDVPRAGGGYQPLDRLTPSQQTLVRALDPGGVVPFVDVANQFTDVGATVSPNALNGLPWGLLSTSLHRPDTPTGQAIAATAEVLTAEICHATGGVPAPVCASSAVADYTSRLARFGGRGGGCPLAAVLRRH
jgi:Domain of unknown function (DUF929)